MCGLSLQLAPLDGSRASWRVGATLPSRGVVAAEGATPATIAVALAEGSLSADDPAPVVTVDVDLGRWLVALDAGQPTPADGVAAALPASMAARWGR